jgi:hypothetical protein
LAKSRKFQLGTAFALSLAMAYPLAQPSLQRSGATVMVGVLLERHADHILLSNGTQIFLGDAVLPEGAEFGRSLSVTYTVEDGKKQADTIELVPDWLLDWMATSGCQLWK